MHLLVTGLIVCAVQVHRFGESSLCIKGDSTPCPTSDVDTRLRERFYTQPLITLIGYEPHQRDECRIRVHVHPL